MGIDTNSEVLRPLAEVARRLPALRGSKPAPSPRTPSRRRKASERAARELEKIGI